MLRRVTITRYVTPLREGSSLPALVEADDGREYVIKFRGAGHGEKALVAEVLAGEIGRRLDLPVPEIVLATLPAEIARAEPHREIRDLLGWSVGLNVGLAFVPGALAKDLSQPPAEGADFAADVIWFDSLVTNPDRTPRNSNLIVHDGRTWLIDHGSALYVHHAWQEPDAHARRPFDRIVDHIFMPFASSLTDADARLAPRVEGSLLDEVLTLPPDEWLGERPDAERRAYRSYLEARLEARPTWVAFAERARQEAQRNAA
ncbi:MAG TPA: HipA family kinase [candidate division Zixibacteria bacterium]|nr:HipA family kinase [candidate division Zixibacteria bacterium]